MARAALHLNDAGITLLDGERVLYRQPGFALLRDDELVTGDEAFASSRVHPRHVQHRYWYALDGELLPDRFFRHLSAADLASRQLEELARALPPGVDELVVAVPAWMGPEQLGLFLGIARELGLPVVALADAAAAATRREYRGAVPVHVDMGLHATTLTRMAQDDGVQVERAETLDACGLHALYDAWLRTIAEAFVRQSRYDPLHAADTEQALLDQLGAWLQQAGRGDRVVLELFAGGMAHRAEIESLTLIGAAAPCYQQIANRLRALLRAHETPAIQLTDRVARLPGLPDMLKARVGGEVFALEPGATARGTLARCRAAAGPDGVRLQRRLPWDQATLEVGADALESAHAGVPPHRLFGDVAWRIDGEPLVIGARGDGGGRQLALDGEMPGVSRRHCALKRENGQCVVEDYSRFGTFLNGHRIDGSTILQVGDSLRVGTPGYEFLLITTDESHGTQA